MYAIERQEDGLFVACKLGSWVDLTALGSHATALCPDRTHTPPSSDPAGPDASRSLITPQAHKTEKVKKNAIEAIQSLVKKRARSQSVANTGSPLETLQSQYHDETLEQRPKRPEALDASGSSLMTPQSTSPAVAVHDTTQVQSSESLLDSIRAMYFEALYKSKVSFDALNGLVTQAHATSRAH